MWHAKAVEVFVPVHNDQGAKRYFPASEENPWQVLGFCGDGKTVTQRGRYKSREDAFLVCAYLRAVNDKTRPEHFSMNERDGAKIWNTHKTQF